MCSGLVPRPTKSLENPAVLVPRGPKSLENTAGLVPRGPESLEDAAALVKYSTFGSARTSLKMSGKTFWGEKPKSLEHNTEFGLSLHLSTRFLHWMWAPGVAPCKLVEEEITFQNCRGTNF